MKTVVSKLQNIAVEFARQMRRPILRLTSHRRPVLTAIILLGTLSCSCPLFVEYALRIHGLSQQGAQRQIQI